MAEIAQSLPWVEGDESSRVWSGTYNLAGLKAVASCIPIVHQSNPESWSLLGTRKGMIAITIWGYGAIGLSPTRGHVLLPGSPDEGRYNSLPGRPGKETIAERGAAFRLQGINDAEFLSVFATFQSGIHEALTWLSHQKAKGTFSRNGEHRPDLVNALATVTGAHLPQPGYFSTSEAGIERSRTGIWLIRQPSHVLVDWRNQHEDVEVRFPWPTVMRDLSTLPDSPAAFRSELESQGVSSADAIRLWRFAKEIQPGDKVVIADGPYGSFFGAGEATGAYVYEANDHVYPHRLRWTPTPERHHYFRQVSEELTQIRHGWGPTPITERELEEIMTPDTSGKPTRDAVVSEPSRLQRQPVNVSTQIAEHFASNGLRYAQHQIATFYTALQTKGFVVLSGISGTGKSKIAQGFVEMLPKGSTTLDPPPALESLSFRVTTNTQEQYWVAIPASRERAFPPLDLDTRQAVAITFDGTVGRGSVILRRLNAGRDTLYISFGKTIGERFRNLEVGRELFIVTELSEQGDSLSALRIVDHSMRHENNLAPEPAKAETANHLFLSVRPDWRDSTSLLGYYNPLTQTYEWTDFLRFLLRAVASYEARDGLAWFVILDEMNLAHVEYYFADLLSVIESGRDMDGWSREPLRFQYPDTLVDNPPPAEIRLPPSLYIIGTVNMDETTHAFSPKVLDRAFTIELTAVDFAGYPGDTGETESLITEAEKAALLRAFTRAGRFAVIDKDDIRAVVAERPEIRDWLQSLNDLLARDRFHFGYRVFDEIAQFVANAGENGMLAFEDAFDHAVFMKVLPKFTGSRARLRSPLLSLLAWAIAPDAPDPIAVDAAFLDVLSSSPGTLESLAANAAFPQVARRAVQMLERLDMDGFVSFG